MALMLQALQFHTDKLPLVMCLLILKLLIIKENIDWYIVGLEIRKQFFASHIHNVVIIFDWVHSAIKGAVTLSKLSCEQVFDA